MQAKGLATRQELLELNLFEDIENAQLLATQWQWINNFHPNSAIGRVLSRQSLKLRNSLFLTNINNEGLLFTEIKGVKEWI